MAVLSLKSRDFLGSGGPEKGASPEGQKFANELARKKGASQYADPPTSRVARVGGNGHVLPQTGSLSCLGMAEQDVSWLLTPRYWIVSSIDVTA